MIWKIHCQSSLSLPPPPVPPVLPKVSEIPAFQQPLIIPPSLAIPSTTIPMGPLDIEPRQRSFSTCSLDVHRPTPSLSEIDPRQRLLNTCNLNVHPPTPPPTEIDLRQRSFSTCSLDVHPPTPPPSPSSSEMTIRKPFLAIALQVGQTWLHNRGIQLEPNQNVHILPSFGIAKKLIYLKSPGSSSVTITVTISTLTSNS